MRSIEEVMNPITIVTKPIMDDKEPVPKWATLAKGLKIGKFLTIPNYYRVGQNLILIDFKPTNLLMIDILAKLSRKKHLHIFISDTSYVYDECFKHFFDQMVQLESHIGKIVIHIPTELGDIAAYIYDNILPDYDKLRTVIITESDGPSFRVPDTKYSFKVSYSNHNVSCLIEFKSSRMSSIKKSDIMIDNKEDN